MPPDALPMRTALLPCTASVVMAAFPAFCQSSKSGTASKPALLGMRLLLQVNGDGVAVAVAGAVAVGV